MDRRSFLASVTAAFGALVFGGNIAHGKPAPKQAMTSWSAWGGDVHGVNGIHGMSGLGDTLHHLTGPVAWPNTNPDLTQISTNGYHAAGIDAAGNLYVWGYNNFYALGTGEAQSTVHSTPFLITQSGLSNIVEVACTAYGTFARRNDGTIFFGGDNSSGEMGDGGTIGFVAGAQHQTFVATTNWSAKAVVQMIHGNAAMAMRTSDGKLWFAGQNNNGEAGNGTFGTNVTTPIQWGTLATDGPKTADARDGFDRPDATLRDATPWQSDNVPTHWAIVNGAAQITESTNNAFSGALERFDGPFPTGGVINYDWTSSHLWCQVLTVPTTSDANVWARMRVNYFNSDGVAWRWKQGNLEAIWQVSSTQTVVYSTPYDPVAHAWWRLDESSGNALWRVSADGVNWTTLYSQAHGFGIEITTMRLDWWLVHAAAGTDTFRIDNVNVSPIVQATVGGNDLLALRATGDVWGSGQNFAGCLMDGSSTRRTAPVQSTGAPSNVLSITLCDATAFTIDTSHQLWAAGYNGDSEVTNSGSGDGTAHTTPVQLTMRSPAKTFSKVVSCASAVDNYAAVTTDGELWAIADNDGKQIDSGAPNSYFTYKRCWTLGNIVDAHSPGGSEGLFLVRVQVRRARVWAMVIG